MALQPPAQGGELGQVRIGSWLAAEPAAEHVRDSVQHLRHAGLPVPPTAPVAPTAPCSPASQSPAAAKSAATASRRAVCRQEWYAASID